MRSASAMAAPVGSAPLRRAREVRAVEVPVSKVRATDTTVVQPVGFGGALRRLHLHASEDKAALARPLAERLRAEHVEVWYDEFSLSVGDSLRRSIDRGLSQSRFGIVVLSPSFFCQAVVGLGTRWVGCTSERRLARGHSSGLARCRTQRCAGVLSLLGRQTGCHERVRT